MPSKEICAKEWKQRNYKNMEDCMGYKKPVETQAQNKNWGKVDKEKGYSAMQKAHGGLSKQIKKKDGSWHGKEKGIPSGLRRRKKK